MANICNNDLKVYSEDNDNIEYIKKFFGKEANVEEIDEYVLEVYFDSKWDFPSKWMDELYENLPNKEDIDMVCLSVEWGGMYCAFHYCDNEGWHLN